jgi:hypothetical protein
MTDEQIIKALECCGDEEITYCSICPLYIQDRENDFCKEDLHRASLDLINRQKAEIERLEDVEFKYEILKKNYDEVEQQLHYLCNVEIPYLYSFTDDKDKKLETLANILLRTRAKAIKDFAERLTHTLVINNEENTEIFDFSYTLETIDNLVKEMLGEQ